MPANSLVLVWSNSAPGYFLYLARRQPDISPSEEKTSFYIRVTTINHPKTDI